MIVMRITDSHFQKLGGGPTRLDHSKIPVAPSGPGVGAVAVVVLVVAGLGVGGWMAWKRSQGAAVEPVESPAVAEVAQPVDNPNGTWKDSDPSPLPSQVQQAPVIVEPEPEVVQPLPVVMAQPATPAQTQGPTAEQIAAINRGIAHLQKQIPEHERKAATLAAQLKDCDTRHWPKPGGTMTYEGWLTDSYHRAKARKDDGAAFKIEGAISAYRTNRASTESQLRHEREIIESLRARIAAEEARR
jgi:hypothetical protein